MKYLLIGLTYFVLLLSACSNEPSENIIQTAIAQTQAAKPTETTVPSATPEPTSTTMPTETVVPLSDIDLVPLLIQEGDLPAGFSGAQIRYLDKTQDSGEDLIVNYAVRDLELNGKAGGTVMVIVFNMQETAIAVYKDRIAELENARENEDVGEIERCLEGKTAVAADLFRESDSQADYQLLYSLDVMHCLKEFY